MMFFSSLDTSPKIWYATRRRLRRKLAVDWLVPFRSVDLQYVNPMLKHNGQDLYPLVHARALDPLTGAVLTLKEIRDAEGDDL